MRLTRSATRQSPECVKMKPYNSTLLQLVVKLKKKTATGRNAFLLACPQPLFFFLSTAREKKRKQETKQKGEKLEKLPSSPGPPLAALAVNKSPLAYIFIRALNDPPQ